MINVVFKTCLESCFTKPKILQNEEVQRIGSLVHVSTFCPRNVTQISKKTLSVLDRVSIITMLMPNQTQCHHLSNDNQSTENKIVINPDNTITVNPV